MQLQWKVSISASCLHAAACMHEGLPVADTTIAATMQLATEALVGELGACGLDAESTLPLLVSLAADFENNRQLIEVAAKKRMGSSALSEATIARLAGCVADVEAVSLREQPALVDELAVRGGPLREQWEARGPGLLRAITRLTVEDFLASAAEVVLVSPLVGGHGRAHLTNNRVTFEAVLANPHHDLPETLRLGWLLAQLNLDVPVLSEPIPPQQLPRLASLATLPLVLAAAESVELAALTVTTLSQTIDCWHLGPSLPNDAPQTLLDWWQTYQQSDTCWPVAMAALGQMLAN